MDRRDFMIGAGVLVTGSLVLPGVARAFRAPLLCRSVSARRKPLHWWPAGDRAQRVLRGYRGSGTTLRGAEDLREFLGDETRHRVLRFDEEYRPHATDVVEGRASILRVFVNWPVEEGYVSWTQTFRDVLVRQTGGHLVHLSGRGESLDDWYRTVSRSG
jgi:hypothetical protein